METNIKTTNKKNVSVKELGDYAKKIAIMSIKLLICIDVCYAGLGIMSEIRKRRDCEKVKGHYRLMGNKLRWINGYWRAKRKH